MTDFDHAESPRLGQRVPYEGTTVRMFTGAELPEVSVNGQIIFRTDTEILQVYSEEDNAWQDVAGGTAGALTYVGDTKPPTPPAKEGDTWYDSANGHKVHVHDGVDFQEILLGADAIDPADLPEGPPGPEGPEGPQGVPGEPGADGQTYYTWIKYADTPTTGMADSPTGKAYMGIASNKTTATESTDYNDYQWSLILGPQGPEGDPGADGSDGATGEQGAPGVSVVSITSYYALVNTGSSAPALPTNNPPNAPWVATEPGYVEGKELYHTELITFSDAEWAYTNVGKSSSYEAAVAAANLADGKMRIFHAPAYGATLPSVVQPVVDGEPVDMAEEDDGDLWFRIDEGNKSYVYDFATTSWIPAPTGINALDNDVTAGNLGGTTPETLPQDLGGNMDDAVITGATIQTVDAPNQGIKLQDGTLKAYPPEGGTAFFDVDPAAGMVIVAGEGTFDSATVIESTELGGTTTVPVGSAVVLAAGTQPPGSAPKVDTDYHIFQFEVSAEHGGFDYRQGWATDGTYWYTAENGTNFTEMVRLDNTGAHVSYGWSEPAAVTCGLTYHSGKIYQLIQLLDANDNRIADQYYVLRHATSTFTNDGTYAWTHSVGTKNPAISHDPATGEICIAQHRDADNDNIRIRWYSVPVGSTGSLTSTGTTDTSLSYDFQLGGLVYGVTDFGFSPTIQTWTTSSWGTGSFRAIATSSESPTRNWESGMPNKVGFTYVSRSPTLTTGAGSATVTGAAGTFNPTDYGSQISGTGIPAGAFITTYNSDTSVVISEIATSNSTAVGTISGWKSMDKTGLMRTYSRLDYDQTMGDTANTRWISSTFFRDQTTDWETPQSNRASILPKKRSRITVTTAALPASPGTNDPNQVQIYIGKGSTEPARTAMWRQKTPAVGAIAATYSTFATSGTNPPSANNFPETTPGKLEGTSKRSDGTTPKVKVDGSGVANVDGLIPPGSMMMWCGITAPPGWAICDGSELSRTGTTKPLADACLISGTNYRFGNGNGTTTFNLPDLRGRFPYGHTPGGVGAYKEIGAYETSTAGGTSPGQAAPETRLEHKHVHTISGQAADGSPGTFGTASGSGVRNAHYGGHSHGGETGEKGLNNASTSNHGFLTINFIIKL